MSYMQPAQILISGTTWPPRVSWYSPGVLESPNTTKDPQGPLAQLGFMGNPGTSGLEQHHILGSSHLTASLVGLISLRVAPFYPHCWPLLKDYIHLSVD